MLTKTFPVAAVAIIAALVAVGASPLQAREPAYGGIGATIAHFNAAHANRPGNPPAGTTYYRVDRTRNGRVEDYHVVVGWKSKRNTSELLARLTGRELPSDAKIVRAYAGYCAIYRSPWLGRVTGLPYITVYAPKNSWWNGVWAGLGPACKG
jgi:hypothetical protein